MISNDKLSTVMFYREVEEECLWCDHYWKIYSNVAKKLRDVMKFYAVDCGVWNDHSAKVVTNFLLP